MNIEQKGKMIGEIVRELRLKAMEVGDHSFCEGLTTNLRRTASGSF